MARTLGEKSLTIFRILGDQANVAIALTTLGLAVRDQGKYVQARALFEQALSIRRKLNDRNAIASSLRDIGSTAHVQGDPVAESVLNESLLMAQELDDQFEIPRCLHDLGMVASRKRDTMQAQTLFAQSLVLFRKQGDKRNTIKCIEGLASVACATGQFERAARLLGAAETWREVSSIPILQMYRAHHTAVIEELHERLKPERLSVLWVEGRMMTLEQAIEFALVGIKMGDALKPSLRQSPKEKFGGLTAREREVAGLIAQGKSNREIAEKLVLSERTIEGHVSNLFNKLGFNARTQIVAWAVQKGLLQSSETLE